MLWLILAIVSAITGGFIGLINRFVVKDHDYISYSFVWQILNALLFLPLFIANFALPSELIGWELMLLGVFFWTVMGFTGFKSVQLVEASLREPVAEAKVLFVLILSSVLISEALTINKIFGTILIFVGLMIIAYRKGMFIRFSEFGIQLTLLTSFLFAIVSIVDKTALKYWNVPSYAFFAFFIPGMIMGGFTISRKDKFMKLVRAKSNYLIIAAFLGLISYYTMYWAYQLTDVSNVFPIIQISSLVTVLGGIVILRERGDIMQKIIATAIMIVGALFVSGYIFV
jgi:drug/metabolite transporter (DMT)-like permease